MLSKAQHEKDPVPFLKWAGGKRWLVYERGNWLKRPFRRYIEPFLGGASAFFHLAPNRAILGDTNPDLICAYRGVRDDPKNIQRLLEKHQRLHNKDYYYKIRSRTPRGAIARAARVIYLNRTCFNGIYRVNLGGNFNVPIGTKSSVLLPTDDFDRLSEILKNTEICLSDFQILVDRAREGDLVYADPPYTVRHNTNGFVKYNEILFSWEDQVRLASSLASARDRGATIIATNAAHNSIRGLYSRFGFKHDSVDRYSSIAASGKKRGQYGELLISSERL